VGGREWYLLLIVMIGRVRRKSGKIVVDFC
jgi:hypothetical protein